MNKKSYVTEEPDRSEETRGDYEKTDSSEVNKKSYVTEEPDRSEETRGDYESEMDRFARAFSYGKRNRRH